jgi:hypothetical protein
MGGIESTLAALMTQVSFTIVKGQLPSKVEVSDELQK